MSKIDTLIADLCPDGVEYRTLNEVCKSGRKGSLKREELITDGAYPVVNGGMGYYGRYDSFNNEGNCVVFSSRGAAGYVSYQHDPFYAAALCYPFFSKDENVLNARFLYFALKTQEKENIERLVSHGGVPALNKEDALNIEIPVPPIEVQREIVRILDTFTELTETLTEELDCRRQQYAYYRGRLLSQENLEALDGRPVEMKRMGDVCVRQKGMPITAAKMKELASEAGDVVVFGGGKTKVLANRGELPKGNVIETPSVVVKSRGNIGFEYCDVPFTNKSELWSYAASSSSVDIKFIYHYLESRRAFFQDAAKVGKLPQISTGVTDDFQVAVPSLATQRKVVDILDRFDALTTSLTDGLPAEIEARKAQYEYYRDRLLDFPRKE